MLYCCASVQRVSPALTVTSEVFAVSAFLSVTWAGALFLEFWSMLFKVSIAWIETPYFCERSQTVSFLATL